MAEKKNLKGLNGWLLFFFIVFILFAASHLYSLFEIIFAPQVIKFVENMMPFGAELPQMGLFAQIISAILMLATLVAYVFAIIGIGQEKAWAKKASMTAVWAGVVYSIVAQILMLSILPEFETYFNSFSPQMPDFFYAMFYASMVINILLALAWAVIVTLYFIKSVRVKHTLVK
jgi:hypothetical protein